MSLVKKKKGKRKGVINKPVVLGADIFFFFFSFLFFASYKWKSLQIISILKIKTSFTLIL